MATLPFLSRYFEERNTAADPSAGTGTVTKTREESDATPMRLTDGYGTQTGTKAREEADVDAPRGELGAAYGTKTTTAQREDADADETIRRVVSPALLGTRTATRSREDGGDADVAPGGPSLWGASVL